MSDIEHILETALNHQRAGELDEAADIYRKVLEIEPAQVDALHLLGMVAHAQQDHGQAIELIKKAIFLNPMIADFHINIASIYLAQGNTAAAKSHAETALKINGEAGEAHYNLGNALFAEGSATDAVQAFRHALDLEPENQTFWANYLFALNFSTEASPKDIHAANKAWGEQVAGSAPPPPEFTNELTAERSLRLAYFLPELDIHVTSRFLSPMLAAHHKAEFEVFLYGSRVDGAEPPANIVSAADHWIDVGGKSAVEIGALMRADKIDILAHPCSFKSRYREVLVQRAAPVQIACTNLVSTTGLSATDYLITDDFISPPDTGDDLYTEQLIRLSGFNTYQQLDEVEDVAPLPAAANGYITFGSCNNIAKLSPDVIRVWAEILAKSPKSKLLLKHRAFDDAARRVLILDAFAAHDIAEDSLIFEGFTADPSAYLSVYNKIDIALDPFPFGGGTVSYEALWMGVPIITLAGEVFMGRLTGSLLHRLDMDNCIAKSEADYGAAATQLADDLGALADLRQGLRARAIATIFDAKTHVAELEAAYKQAWQGYCDDQQRA
tara:strand:- start:1242 stop:2906 length:1665 start_codon:yes stop_codon:yes gene_type:complete